MTDPRRAGLYQAFLVEPGLERLDLLRLVHDRTSARTVLYPGSSIHVTPSRLFEHVVYVDRSPLARDFFADPAAVLGLVRGSATARASATLRFVEGDFTSSLPFPEGSFDLLIALGAGAVTRNCRRYVRAGGFVLSDDHEGDAFDACGFPDLALVGAFVRRGATVALEERDLARFLEPRAPPHARAARGPRRAGRPPYLHDAEAYLFARGRAR